MKKKTEITDLEECQDKIFNLLSEYNCRIEWDEEVDLIIIVDLDTKEFADL